MAYTTPEAKVTNECMAYLKELKDRGVPIEWEHRSGTGGFAYKKGIPDMFIIIGPYHIEAELKCIDGHLSTMQVKWKNRFIRNGTPYVNPHSFQEFKEYIDKFLNLVK